jgi:ubiquinone/menaquinone biosynthesis C-methylase UbiE
MEISCERLTLSADFNPDVEREHLERYRYAANFVKNADVLDIACGSGYGSKMLADAGARSVRGFDIDKSATEYASERFIAANLSYVQGNAEELTGIPDNSADVIVSFETIEHLHHVDSYLREMRRILRPGGHYFVSTPDRRLASTLYPLRGKPNNGFHIREFTGPQLREMLENVGFEVLEFGGQNYIPNKLVFWPLQVLLKGSGYALRQFGGAKLVRNIYHLGSGFTVKPQSDFEEHVARYWVVRCRRPFLDVGNGEAKARNNAKTNA